MGKWLPASWQIAAARWIWRSLWRLMMSRLAPVGERGDYQRPSSQFRNAISKQGDYPPEKGRYRLYVGMSCPWAHRTTIVRALKGLEDVIEVVVVIPSVTSGGWVMKDASEGCVTLCQLYKLSSPGYRGRCTVPVLWDTKSKRIVNNESGEIIVYLNSQFNQWAKNPQLDLYPASLRGEIDSWNEKIYEYINNGVYKCGFAQTQEAYESACRLLFATLDEIDSHLKSNRYLCGDNFTLADVRLFPTLIRFDAIYYPLFKCSIRPLQSYQHISRYLQDINNLPGIRNTYCLDTIKKDYYSSLFPLNPSGIIPL
ncbi:MAG: glutathione S-transferase C-terminal domain-containing protein [Geminocystis sp.]|nr:glutathione S-transferase C-terminal domain-containing protein [Geminocystis sp.]HIK36512.1 glutathione S-transferase C-terminal domain-containing protein [Geminocystis sp. M7585_C2015_104]MCS7146743.1 glutathione S-transferase C-terminal domain-containing protein [Geminocystis sp.]MCX8077107.1 glutathione S-transferase C-terminal domain-containing protein [Geminocystis sp.]MDW8115569.1 glutathione S-transferase C-terminal domain-containing protein [Geminocystis sp.]